MTDPLKTRLREGEDPPRYCKHCGAAFAEYMACELPDCELEELPLRTALAGGG